MKKLLTFLPLILILLSSCSDDDKKTTSVDIAGKWQAESRERYECPEAGDNGTLTCGTYAFCFIIEFKADNIFQINRTSNGEFLASGTYVLIEDQLAINLQDNPAALFFTRDSIVRSGNTLTTATAEETTSCKTRMVYQKID